MRFWFRFSIWIYVAASLLGLVLAASSRALVSAQAAATPQNTVQADTPTPGGPTPYITVLDVGEPQINVRTGPNTVFYPDPCGYLPVGTTAPAIGASPNRSWIQISFPGCPGGVGWVYSANVTLSPGFLPVVEPPPTPTPLATNTIDPTLAAQFNIQPTGTRLPTFTAPAPLVVPTFNASAVSASGFPMGMVIAAVALIGALVLVVSFVARR